MQANHEMFDRVAANYVPLSMAARVRASAGVLHEIGISKGDAVNSRSN